MKIFENDNYYYLIDTNLSYEEICYYLDLKSIDEPENIEKEIGPHKMFKSSFSTNVMRIIERLNLDIKSFEKIKIIKKNNNYDIDELVEEDYTNPKENRIINYPKKFNLNNINIELELKKWGISFDNDEMIYYKNLFNNLNRQPTFTEIFDICQSNSEHSRHWFFKGNLYKNKIKVLNSLFSLIKKTNNSLTNSLVAFSDNSSVIKGFKVFKTNNINNLITIKENLYDLVFTAETHNFPTLVYPFEGAATGIGGRIRDNHATGRGAYLTAGTAGYIVGELNTKKIGNYPEPKKILIEASNGASDYGNKIGEPIINGFTRAFGINLGGDRIEYIKPILFTGGVGYINHKHIYKKLPKFGMLVVRIGGPVYKIGMGGGFASSIEQGGEFKNFERSSVQRGDPQYENKLNRVITQLCDMNEDNPIISIHDQGAGGLANCVKELVSPNGAYINLNNVTLGDTTLQGPEIWCSEFQESDVLLIEENNIEILNNICKKEGVYIDILGKIDDSKEIKVYFNKELILNLPLKEILEPPLTKKYNLEKCYTYKDFPPNINIYIIPKLIEIVFKSLSVCSKRFLTNKVDRSVTGLIAQQQCVGPYHTPLSNYGLTSLSYFNSCGTAISVGEKPVLGLLNPKAQGGMSVGEMITNMMGVAITDIKDIKCSGNWMWNIKAKGEYDAVHKTAIEMCNVMKELGISLDGGKDSLSMSVKNNDKIITSPGTLVISGYAPCPDIYCKVTPNLKNTNTSLLFLHFDNYRMGGSILYKQFENIGWYPPMLDNPKKLKKLFEAIQIFIKEGKILSLHDRSDGGLITTLIEMSLSSNIGLNVFLPTEQYNESINYLFNEELGVVIEIYEPFLKEIENVMKKIKVKCDFIGITRNDNKFMVTDKENDLLVDCSLKELSNYWEFTCFELDKQQIPIQLAFQEYTYYLHSRFINNYYLPDNLYEFCKKEYYVTNINYNINTQKVAIIREEGSNGDKEMEAAFYYVGFEVYNFTTSELNEKPELLDKIKGIIFVGGFSFSDVLGAAKGWYLSITKNNKLYKALLNFFENPNNFSLGICNGCQLMIRTNIIDDYVKLNENKSERFESRFSTVKINKNNSIFFKNMEDMIFGIWVAHREGRFTNTNRLSKKQICLQYFHNNEVTNYYPHNPNGSEKGIAGICSKDGRHTVLMPHPERCFLKWQIPYCNKYENILTSPWIYMFKNSYEWCKNN